MKMMKLLGGACAAALIAGAANAQTLDLVLVDPNGVAAGPDIATTYMIADEVDFTALSNLTTGSSATVGLEVLTEGQIPPGQNVLLTIQVNNGVFSSALTDGNTHVVSGLTGAVVQDGGAAGSNTVQFNVTTDAADLSVADPGDRDGLGLILPITMLSCGDVTFEVTQFETAPPGSLPIEGGVATLSDLAGDDDEAIICDDAFDASLAVDADDTVINFASGFINFLVGAPDTATTAELGEFNLTVDPMYHVDLQGTDADFSMVTGFSVDIDFTRDATGIATGEAIPTAGAIFDAGPTAPVGNTITLAGTVDATANTSTGDFDVASVNDTDFPILTQVVNASDGIITLNAPFLTPSDDFTAQDVEDLIINGSTFGPFDWVADTSGRVNSIFRITGLAGQTDDIRSMIIVENARNGSTFNGVFPFTVAASDIQGSEVRLTSSDLEAAAGGFGTADITMVFGDTLNLDVDRLLSGPSTATVVPFGDNANADDGVGPDDDSLVRQPSNNDDDNGIFQ